MSQINLKSILGITSITTPAGVDDVFTVHSNDTTERFRVDQNGNQVIAGILTVTQDLNVDGHTNLDNVSIAGVTTFSHTGANQLVIKDSDTSGDNAHMRISFQDSGGTEKFFVGNNNSNGWLYIGSASGQNNNTVVRVNGQDKIQVNSNGLYVGGYIEILDTILHSGDTDTKIRFPEPNKISFETGGTERLRIDNVGVLYTGNYTTTLDSTPGSLQVNGDTAGGRLGFRGTTTSAYGGLGEMHGYWDTNKVASILFHAGSDTTNKDDGEIRMYTRPSGGTAAARLNITSTGRLNTGDTDLTQNTDQFSVTIAAQNAIDNVARFQSTAASSGTSETLVKIYKGAGYGGVISGYITQGSDHGLKLYTANNGALSERLRATSTGIIDAPSQAGFYARMQNNKSNVMGGGASYYTVQFDTDSGSVCYDTHDTYDPSTGLYTVPTHGTGHYVVSTAVCLSTSVYGRGGEIWFLVGSQRYFFDRKYFTATGGTITGFYGSINLKLTAGQTIGVQGFISGGSQNVDVLGANATDQITWFTARKIA